MEWYILERRIVKGIIVFLAVIFGFVLAATNMALSDSGLRWILAVSIPGGLLDLILFKGALNVLANEYSN